MAKDVWLGGTSDDVTVDANWQSGSKPVDGDVVHLNDQAARDMANGLTDTYWKDIDLTIVVEKTWTRKVAVSGTPWTIGGIDRLIFQGNQSAASSYFKAYNNVDEGTPGSGSSVTALCVCDTRSMREDVLNLDGLIDRISCLNGVMQVTSGATVQVRMTANGGTLNIPTGVTLTGVEASALGGVINCESSIPTVLVGGGTFILDSGADISTYLEVNDGTFRWQGEGTKDPPGSHSTIALAECYGGVFQTILERQFRTLTEMNMYKTATVDLTAGGLLMTLPTNGIGVFGDNSPKMPSGSRHTIAV